MASPVRWKLHIVGPDGAAHTVPVSRDLVLGRDTEADLRLNDSSVSRRHAQLSLDASGALTVEDLGSANGVVVDDRRIGEKAKLRNGAVLKIGLFTLTAERLIDATVEQPPASDRAKPPKGSLAPPIDPREEQLPDQPVLRFRTGPLAGRDVALIRREISLGRIVEGNDIVIPDESVSRRHAEFARLGRGYSVRDLQSVNGTSVNGARIVQQKLRAGDRIKIGIIEADYLGPNAEAAKPVDRRLLKRVVIAASVLLFVVLVAEGLQLYRVYRARVIALQQPEDQDASSVEKSLADAQAARREERWDRALAAYQEAVAQDPVNSDARKGLKEVQVEIQMKQLFDRARQRGEVGQDEDGVELYLQILPSSIYYPRARAEVHRLAELLKRHYDEDCKISLRAEDQQGILQSCARYLNLVCNSMVDQSRLKAVRLAEKKLGAKNRAPPWACPATYARWFSEDAVIQSSSVEERIAQKYKNPRLAQVVRIYAGGAARTALSQLTALKVTPAEAHDPDLDQLVKQIELAFGASNDEASSLGAGDIRGALRQWNTLLEADKQIMPAGDESTMATEASVQLAKQYYKNGEKLFQRGQLIDAFRTWDEGLKIQQDNDLLQGFVDLENAASKLVEDDSSCDALGQALQITRGGSLNHKRAARLATEHKCRL